MRKYLVTRLVAGLIVAAAIVTLIVGIVAASALGLSGGWGPGSRAWVVVPIVIITLFNTAVLLVFGAVLYFSTKIEMNLEMLRQRGKPGRPRARVVTPPPAPTLDRGPSEPVEERTLEAAVVASGTALAATESAAEPAVEPASETPGDQPAVAEDVEPEKPVEAPADADAGNNRGSVKLPGTDEAARIAREMAAARPESGTPSGDTPPAAPEGPPADPAA